MADVYDAYAAIGKKLLECGEHRMSLRSALATIEYWATDVPDDKLRDRMALIKEYVSEAKHIGLGEENE